VQTERTRLVVKWHDKKDVLILVRGSHTVSLNTTERQSTGLT